MIKMTIVRLVLSLALHFSWQIHQLLDVKNAFLHDLITENIHMMQPQGFVDITHPTYVCSLKKAIYGLRQAPRAWDSWLSNFLTSQGFQMSHCDNSSFIH